jgi:LacI family transcriptional regulator
MIRSDMTQSPHVALIVETSIHYGREILTGATKYLKTHRSWSVFLEQRDLWTPPPTWLRQWRGDGVICRKTTPQLVKMLRKAGIPLVDLNDRVGPLGAPKITSDDRAIGILAADHLLDRGFVTFAFCGFSHQAWSTGRREGYIARLKERGHDCEIYESPWIGRHASTWEREQSQISKWLATLPRPIALFASSDARGQHVLDACQRLNVAVPEEVAVIGVDDDTVLCNLCQPPMSSVIPNAAGVGYQAAEILDRMICGDKVADVVLKIPPLGIQTRQSSEILAIDDPAVANALRFIRQQAQFGCGMKDVIRQTAVSRSVLERKFRKYLGHSPQAEIRKVQLRRVKQLLSESELPLHEVATLAGYSHPEYMCVVFKKETGKTPGEFRAAASVGRA